MADPQLTCPPFLDILKLQMDSLSSMSQHLTESLLTPQESSKMDIQIIELKEPFRATVIIHLMCLISFALCCAVCGPFYHP